MLKDLPSPMVPPAGNQPSLQRAWEGHLRSKPWAQQVEALTTKPENLNAIRPEPVRREPAPLSCPWASTRINFNILFYVVSTLIDYNCLM